MLRLQREVGRYLLASAHAPGAVVQGDLGWTSWDFLALERAANLVSRLASASDMRLAVRVFLYARNKPSSWSCLLTVALAADPFAMGLRRER